MSISRRDFMSLVGGSVAGAAVVAAGSRVASGPATAQAGGGLRGWYIADIGQVSLGAVPIVVSHRHTGEQLRIEVCARGSRANPVASSERFDLFVANGGSGHVRTHRDHLLVARALSRKLDEEVRQAPTGLLSMADRQHQHRELYQTCDDIANA